MFVDPNADLLNQLTRIADALSKPSPSPWIEWAKNLASFVAGIALTYFSIALQGRLGDMREQRKMRRIIYVELTHSFLCLLDIASGLRETKKPVRSQNAAGEIHPPSVRVVNRPFTFEGEDYMRENRSVSYELSEMVALKMFYHDLRLMSPGQSVMLGELEGTLMNFGKAFRSDEVIRNNFRKFAGKNFGEIESIANHFADHKIKPEDLLILVKEKPSSDSA